MDIGTIGCVVIGLGGLAVGAVAVWRHSLVMEHMAQTHRAMSEAMAKLAQSRPFHIFERTAGGEVAGLANDERGQYPAPTSTTIHQHLGKGVPVTPPPMDLLDPEAREGDYVTASDRNP